MCLPERNTDRRGRVPWVARRWRVRDWRFLKRAFVILLLLAFLAADILALIAHALALIGLRRTPGTDLGRNLADQLLVNARHADHGRLFGGERDAGGDLVWFVVV